ncbi:serine-rich adhesin for platelets-like isoform X1 [Bactrocera tryoni]|uniref:serine-rich adhesin for platelets-like isoform X1 n=1 Tax=Bactrocera tryoni TaxID=59916 RepID=UPI001A95A41C|nr:serine-rich adhesin for platelets-like isoform X1 [Bactrocera tryoni]
MELPSMVQRSGDTLIVRSVVSGNQLYLDQGAASTNNLNNNKHSSPSPLQQQQQQSINAANLSNSTLEQFERYRAAAAQYHLQQQQHHNAAQQQQNAAAASAVAQQQAMELKDEGLPQCKIKRNYSCSYCTYFTQNPRYHLTHLRDVHGEKIVINKCKLCLYASRHFQKLVRHMKMVHGCTDGVTGGHGQPRGKRGMSREARKRKLEQSVGLGSAPLEMNSGGSNMGMTEGMPTYEQVKRELELQRESLMAVVYERELQAQRERELEVRQQAQNAYEQEMQAANAAAATETQRRQSPINAINNNSNNANVITNGSSNSVINSQKEFQLPPAHQQSLNINTHSIELSSSPTDSVSSGQGTDAATSAALHSSGVSLSYVGDEPSQNRLLKCSLCDFTTLFRAQLLDHEMDEHCKTKFFRCEKCSYVTHIKARFSKHVKYHSMPMIKCVTCDFRTPYKWNLDRHMKNHGGAGPFKCAACDFTADIKQSLTVHEMNHHVPPVGHAAGMSLARRRNKVGGTDLCDDFLSDSVDLIEDHYNNNNLDEYDEALMTAEPYSKRSKYDDDEPTDLSAKGGSSDTSSVHNQSVSLAQTPKAKRPIPNLIPIPKNSGSNIMNLSKEFATPRSSLTDIASIFLNDKHISEILEKTDAAQLSPTPTVASTSSHASRSLLLKKSTPGGSFFDKLKSSALTGPNENLICPCGHMAKCLSESIIHRKSCNFAAIAEDDIEEEQDDADDRLEIDFADDDDRQSHSALNLSVTGSTRCQHCRHRCKSSADLLNHLKQCTEASRCGNDSFDSLSGESNGGRVGCADSNTEQHPMENRVFIWNKIPGGEPRQREGSQCSDSRGQANNTMESSGSSGHGASSATCEENSYYGVETAPGYGEVTKKMTPEEEAANSSLKKVYKCPHCSFWASTASRFHVHIVGHLNKKPFECSLCSYRSNWRWDITKHIRLKTIRDPSHKNARVLMNDETGRRNYTKYNKYITLMKVTEEDGDPKLMKSGEMTPNQVASLSFINDFNKGVVPNALTSTHLNGIKEDITLEPIPSKSSNGGSGNNSGDQLNESFIRIPFLATMMNAAMAQQQHQQQKDSDQGQATMITPSVTISAVKRSPPPLMKPSDDLVTDVRQEGNEKKTFYRCRKCSFRHTNRDAVLAHVKIHYQDANYPIVTATATTSPKSANSQQQHNTPLQVAVNPNIYMNKVLAAMCLSQQPNSSTPTNNNNNDQQHSIISAGLLQQAIQGASPNSPLGCLALTLAGKSPAKATASILEHGEQKATQNEASATRPTSPKQQQQHSNNQNNISIANLASSSATSPSPKSSGSNNVNGGVGMVGTPTSASSLQHLLTSPRGTYTSSSNSSLRNPVHSPTTINSNNNNGGSVGGVTNNNNNCKNLVMGAFAVMKHNSAATNTNDSVFGSPTSANATTDANSTSSSSVLASPNAGVAQHNTPSGTTVTTLSTTPSNSTAAIGVKSANNNPYHLQMGLIGATSMSNNHNGGSGSVVGGGGGVIASQMTHSDNKNSLCIGGIIFGSNNPTTTTTSTSLIRNTSIPTTTNSTTTLASSPTTAGHSSGGASSSTSCNLLLSSAQSATAAAAAAAAAALYASNAITLSPPSASSCISANATANNFNNLTQNLNQSQNNNCSNLLVNDSERREPSPYRCGHCHQVSNWKHVIQRHCRLKHAGDIRIETLDRSVNSNERNAPPVYRPLGNGATNESNYGQTLKALQQQQQQHLQQQHQQQQSPHLNNMSVPPGNSVLMSNNKNEQHLLHSPLAGTAAANAATTPQELQQAAAAYIAATYKAAAAAANSAGNGSAAAAVAAAAALGLSSEDLLLHQQLQQNDQIEITRLPPGVGNSAAGQSSQSSQAQQPQQQQQQQLNSKCKQQKCPMCPYISESKSQMNYHISLHKPTQYECSLCTFVCAKKQHLSSHMRTVHQQHNLGASNQMSNSISAAINSMDFSMALQLAAVAQAQQDPSSLNSPLAIDLTALKQKISAVQQQQQQQRQSQQAAALNTQQQQHLHINAQSAAENQIKCILYCPKCPARYMQKYTDTSNAKAELEDHLKYHSGSDTMTRMGNSKQTAAPAFKCEFCDYAAAHEAYIQKHRYVHTQNYQDKYAELYKQVHEDAEYAPPKLMQITLAKSLQQAPETIWIVDNDLNEQCKEHQQQHASISSSSVAPATMSTLAATTMTATAHFDTANSLLKKQLESGMGGSSGGGGSTALRHTPSPTHTPKELNTADADDSSNMPSTSASVATSDLAVDGGSDFTSSIASPAPMEKCLYCPYETKHTTLYKAHLQHHICISNQKEAFTCEHCDYTDAKQEHIEEHTRVHFNAVEKLKSVAFFTSYDNLELSVEQEGGADESATAATTSTEQELESQNERQAENSKATSSSCEAQDNLQNENVADVSAMLLLNIKQEHNNNNEEHVINENVLKEQQLSAASAPKGGSSSSSGIKIKVDSDDKAMEKTTTTVAENMKKPCNKIILYKNDGCLSIKREGACNSSNNNNNASANCENISDRLRRRISRNNSNNANHLNGNTNNNNNNNISDEQTVAVAGCGSGAQPPSHKTILVNAKTGQVISRN